MLFPTFQTVLADTLPQGNRVTSLEDIAKFNEILIQLDLVNKVASWNIAYLAIAITIIIITSGLGNYLLITRPAKEREDEQHRKIKEQELKIDLLSGLLRNNIDEIKTNVDNIINTETKKLEEKFETLKDNLENNELDTIWTKSYMWDGRGLYELSLDSLLDWAEKSFRYNKFYAEKLWAERSLRTCKKIQKITSIGESEKRKDLERFEKIIIKIEIDDSLKKELRGELLRIFS